MAHYTMTIEELCLTVIKASQWEAYDNVDELISQAMPKIFDFDYPFFNPPAKEDFQKQFLLHFFFREICTTPIGRWKVMLRARLMEIMPYYSKLYESDGFKYDPLKNIDYSLNGGDTATEGTNYTREQKTTGQSDMKRDESGGGSANGEYNTQTHNEGTTQGESHGTTEGTSQNSGTNSATKTQKYSDTPQSNIPWNDVAGLNYLTNVTQETESGSHSDSGETAGKNDGTTSGSDTRDGTERGNSKSSNNWDSTAKQGDTTSGTNDITDETKFDHTRDWQEYRGGKTDNVTYQQLVQQWRDLQIEYYRRIFEDLADCFFLLY